MVGVHIEESSIDRALFYIAVYANASFASRIEPNVMDGNDLAARVRMALAADGRTQKEIADALGWDPSKLSRYGSRTDPMEPGAGAAAALVAELGVSGHWLLTGEGPMYPEQEDAQAEAFEAIAHIVQAVRGEYATPGVGGSALRLKLDRIAQALHGSSDAPKAKRRANGHDPREDPA